MCWATPNHRGNYFCLVRLGQLSDKYCFCPSASLACGARNASHKVVPKTAKFGGCSSHLMWEM